MSPFWNSFFNLKIAFCLGRLWYSHFHLQLVLQNDLISRKVELWLWSSDCVWISKLSRFSQIFPWNKFYRRNSPDFIFLCRNPSEFIFHAGIHCLSRSRFVRNQYCFPRNWYRYFPYLKIATYFSRNYVQFPENCSGKRFYSEEDKMINLWFDSCRNILNCRLLSRNFLRNDIYFT